MHASNSCQLSYWMWYIYLLFTNRTTLYVTYIFIRLSLKRLLHDIICSRLYMPYAVETWPHAGFHALSIWNSRQFMWWEWLTERFIVQMHHLFGHNKSLWWSWTFGVLTEVPHSSQVSHQLILAFLPIRDK